MAYGTPFLLQLGMSKSLMSLVWLAGPLSVQASCRTLIVDSLPSSQQEAAAAWASRLMGLGGIFGYFMGNVNLPELIPAFGNTQIKGLCVVACLFLVWNVGLTCFAVTEKVFVRAPKVSSSFITEFILGFKSIFRSIRYLPTRIQHLCNVQFFAWMGWFPFLFYSSTYIAEIYTREQLDHEEPTGPTGPSAPDEAASVQDAAVRAGSFCLLIYSIVSLIASLLLPIVVSPASESGQRSGPLSRSAMNSNEEEMLSTKKTSRWSRTRLTSWKGLPIPGLTLPKMYTLSLALVSVSLVATWVIQDLRGSTILFSFCGISWAVSMWAPFSILGEVISQRMQEEQHQERNRAHRISQSDEQGPHNEVLFSSFMEADDEDTEEIQMSEGRLYHALGGRESLEQVETKQLIANTNAVPIERAQERASSHIDSESDTEGMTDDDDRSGSHCKQSQNRRLVRPYNRSRLGLPVNERDSKTRRHSGRDYRNSNQSHFSSFRSSSSEVDQVGHATTRTGSFSDASAEISSTPGRDVEATSAGALLGIHNIYIVLPQFLVSFLSSVVFAAIEPKTGQGHPDVTSPQDEAPGNPDTIGVMLRFGGVMAGIAAFLSLRLWKQPRM
ncbi:hypothetical protein BGZ94_002136 [Podila epigama]|nr:hypothetical protein BGZ94_002136 [Podila epigama]